MAVTLPSGVAAVNVSDYNLSKVQDGLVKPVNALLAYAKGLQTGQTGETVLAKTRHVLMSPSQDSTTIAAGISLRFPTNLIVAPQMPMAGTVVALSVSMTNGTVTAGTLTFSGRVGTTIDSQALVLSTAVNRTYLLLPVPIPFVAGDTVAIHVVSSGGYTGTGYVSAALWVIA